MYLLSQASSMERPTNNELMRLANIVCIQSLMYLISLCHRAQLLSKNN